MHPKLVGFGAQFEDVAVESNSILDTFRMQRTDPVTLRWPDTIYLHIGRLFSIQIFDHSAAALDCRDILDAEKGMLEVY